MKIIIVKITKRKNVVNIKTQLKDIYQCYDIKLCFVFIIN